MSQSKQNPTRRAWPLAAATLLTMAPALAVTAQAATSDELAELVRQQSAMLKQQAAQIEKLQERLDDVEQSQGVAATTAPAPARTQPRVATSVPTAEVKTAPDDGKTESLRDLRSRVALLEAGNASQSGIDWSDGAPEFISPDGERSFKIGGRLQFDASTTHGSRFDDTGADRNVSGTEARRLRLDASGQLARWLGYKLEYDLANNGASVRDAFLKTGFGLGSNDVALYLGNKYDDRTLDGATSSNKTWFMERSLVNEAIAPDRGSYGLGIKGKIYDGGRNWHGSFAITSGEVGRDNDTSDNVTYMSRVHWNPWRSGENMVHLGTWGFYEDFDQTDSTVFKNTRIADHFNENATIRSRGISDPDNSTAYGFELATSLGSFAAAAEYGERAVDQREESGDETMRYDAYSVQAGYFLTGEHHGYSHKSGVWKFPEVKHPLSAGGIGAFEIAARYQGLDYFDAPDYPGGNGRSRTFGLNWYPNDWSRLMVNYILWDTNNRSGDFQGADDGNTLSARVQVVF
ncbi:OprO/OprP family phosphate-selective porin [Salinisphaera aquimarina]|uniref:Porin n=1 Tax=Salinisphaera aquimarina TaxID=2094031 RepID=A0ABV7EKC7_9GAMM